MNFLPLGDSYTIGTSVAVRGRWPNQLVALLAERGVPLRLAGNPAVNGYTSADLIRDELPEVERLRPGLVSVLIGVNDVVRRVPLDSYAANVEVILERLAATVEVRWVLTVATPDYTLTPAGCDYGDPITNRDTIRRCNDALRSAAERRAIPFVDITPIANAVPADPRLVASDGLHPSGLQYLAWAELMAPVVAGMLSERG